MKMNTDGSNLEELGSTGGFTIVAMDYHHRLVDKYRSPHRVEIWDVCMLPTTTTTTAAAVRKTHRSPWCSLLTKW